MLRGYGIVSPITVFEVSLRQFLYQLLVLEVLPKSFLTNHLRRSLALLTSIKFEILASVAASWYVEIWPCIVCYATCKNRGVPKSLWPKKSTIFLREAFELLNKTSCPIIFNTSLTYGYCVSVNSGNRGLVHCVVECLIERDVLFLALFNDGVWVLVLVSDLESISPVLFSHLKGPVRRVLFHRGSERVLSKLHLNLIIKGDYFCRSWVWERFIMVVPLDTPISHLELRDCNDIKPRWVGNWILILMGSSKGRVSWSN